MKTAVEFYAEQMQIKEQFTQEEFNNITNQAKEMEKQQIIDAYIYGKYEGDLVVMSDKYYAEQYYNETFNI